MGVPQFLTMVLDSAGRSVDLRLFAEGIQTQDGRSTRQLQAAVDVSSWIYRAAQGLGDQLADERHLSNYGRATLALQQQQQQQCPLSPSTRVQGTAQPMQPVQPEQEKVQRYITNCTNYVLERLKKLKEQSHANLLIVFDGATPPIKRQEVAARNSKRAEAEKQRDEPVDLSGEGQEQRIKAFRRAGAGQHYSTIVTHLIQALRVNHFAFLVAPYEADGQLAYLRATQTIDLIITEDSDLVAHQGASPLLFKVSNAICDDGLPRGKLLRREDWGGAVHNSLDLTGMSWSLLAVVFVCAGCDYCPKLRGIGMVTACNIVRAAFLDRIVVADTPKPPLQVVFDKLYQSTYEDKNVLTEEFKRTFEANFIAALLMFRHPVVYDPIRGRCVTVGDPDSKGGDPELIAYQPYADLVQSPERRAAVAGSHFGSTLSTLIAEGWVSPRTQQPRDGVELPAHIIQAIRQSVPSPDKDNEEEGLEEQEEENEPETQQEDTLETQQMEV